MTALKNERTTAIQQHFGGSKKELAVVVKEHLMKEPDWIYYQKVSAHRTYLLAMSVYKHLRFGWKANSDFSKSKWASFLNQDPLSMAQNKWFNMDQLFIKVIERYNSKDLSVNKFTTEPIEMRVTEYTTGRKKQPIFIDLIIKVMLCRVYANVMDRKLLTAEKILDNAEALIEHVISGHTL